MSRSAIKTNSEMSHLLIVQIPRFRFTASRLRWLAGRIAIRRMVDSDYGGMWRTGVNQQWPSVSTVATLTIRRNSLRPTRAGVRFVARLLTGGCDFISALLQLPVLPRVRAHGLRQTFIIAGLTRNLCARTPMVQCPQILNHVQDDTTGGCAFCSPPACRRVRLYFGIDSIA
jgi:hypothetical protein